MQSAKRDRQESARLYREKNRERRSNYQREWEERNPEYSREYREKNRERITKEQRRSRRANPERRMLASAKQRAKRKGLEFTVSTENLLPLPTHCPVLGIPLGIQDVRCHPNSYSLDRIDNMKGYTPDNVRVISNRANLLKGTASTEEIRKLLSYMESNGV